MSHLISAPRRSRKSSGYVGKWEPITPEEQRIISRVVAGRGDSAESVVFQEKSNNKRAGGYLIPVGEYNRAARASNYSVTYANF
jgi:hypothetical protein